MGLFDSLFNHWSATQQSMLNFEHSKALQQHQYDLNRSALREYFSNNRYSLENAGYNPLLAIPGSTAQGFSASASLGSSPGLGSGIGTDELNSITSALTAKEQRKLAKEQVESVKEDTKNKKLQNEKLRNEIDTSPRTIINDLVLKGKNNAVNSAIAKLQQVKSKYGLGFIEPRSFVKTNIGRLKNGLKYLQNHFSAKSTQNYSRPFEIGIKYFDEPKNKDELGIWNSSRKVHGRVLSDSESRRYLSRRSNKIYNYNRPPKNFPSGM